MATIEVQESVLSRLKVQAAGQGLTLEGYLEQLAELRALKNGKLSPLSGEELEQLLDAEASSATTYQGTYSRADIYRDHD